MRYIQRNLDGRGIKRVVVYDVRVVDKNNYWSSVTNVPCPTKNCDGTIIWHESGFVPGYRICNKCLKHFIADGSSTEPSLIRFGTRSGL